MWNGRLVPNTVHQKKHLQLANATRDEHAGGKKTRFAGIKAKLHRLSTFRLNICALIRKQVIELQAGTVFSFHSRPPLYLHLILPIQPFYIFITGVGNAKTIRAISAISGRCIKPPNIRQNYFPPLLLQIIYLFSCVHPKAFWSKQSFLNQFFITSPPMAHQSASPTRHHGKETIHFALILTFLSTYTQQGSITQRARCKYLKDFLSFFPLLPSWREYSRSKVTSHMP